MQITQRRDKKIVVIDDSMLVKVGGRLPSKEEAERIIGEAQKAPDGLLKKMLDLKEFVKNGQIEH